MFIIMLEQWLYSYNKNNITLTHNISTTVSGKYLVMEMVSCQLLCEGFWRARSACVGLLCVGRLEESISVPSRQDAES